jgi:hypothetical protein
VKLSKTQKVLFISALFLLIVSFFYYTYVARKFVFKHSYTEGGSAFSCRRFLSEDFECYEAYYSTLVRERGVADAFADLRARYNTNTYVKENCHPITHVIGRVAIEKYPTLSEAYTYGDSFCWSGYYHGALEGIIAKMGRAEVPNQLNTICADIPGKERYSFDYFNCIHGLGHGLMAYTNHELFDALTLCDRLEGIWEKRSCYGGVFMENLIVDNNNHATTYLDPKDPIYPCNAVPDTYKTDCFLMQTSYMLKVTGNDYAKVFSLCSTVGDGYRQTCYQSLGRDASGRIQVILKLQKHDACLA